MTPVQDIRPALAHRVSIVRETRDCSACDKAMSAMLGRLAWTAFDHPQGIAAFWARFAAELIHQRPHQEHPTAAYPDFGGGELGHCVQVESFTFIHQTDFDRLVLEPAADLELRIGPVLVSMPDDVAGGFIGREHDG